MFRKILFIFTVLTFTSVYSYSQESCACSSTGCTASQSCPAGKSAVCVCGGGSCGSSCSITDELPNNNRSAVKLEDANAENIGGVLSSIYGVNVQFKSTVKDYKFSDSKGLNASSWNLLEELSQNGELSINNQKIDFWKGIRKTLLEGGDLKICFGGATPQKILNVVSFISGKKYSITSGDAESKITGQVTGNNLSEIIASLQKTGGVTISENN